MRSLLRARLETTSPVATASGLAIALMLHAATAQAQQPVELVIHNGLVINEEGRLRADIRVVGEKVVEIAPKIVAARGAKEIDATGLFLLPGAIDTHTHLDLEPIEKPEPTVRHEDLTTGSAAALAGGVTTVSDFIPIQKDETPDAYVDRITKSIDRHAIADVFMHVNVSPVGTPEGSPPDPLTLKSTYDAFAARGIVATGEDRMPLESFDRNSLTWMKKFRAAGQAGVLSTLHAEDYAIIAESIDRIKTENGGTGNTLHNFAQSAPIIAEVLAVQRGVAAAEATGSPIMINHISSGRALKVVEDAQRRGLPVYVETRPMYLHVTARKYSQPDVGLWIGGPPVRDQWDQDMIWDGIRRGVIHTIGSDHNGFSKAAKLDPTQNFFNKRMGFNNLQDYPAMMFSEGVLKDRITLEQFVAVTSTNAAKIFGMYPRKGVIAVGSDADIVLWDPKVTKTLTDADEFSIVKYSTYAGMEVTGFPRTTIRRGEIVFDKGKILGKPGSGRLIPGAKFQRPMLRPISD